jgi:hypothetical protein
MLWQRGAPPSNDDQELATRAPVQAGFPATFTVHLYQPPPSAARKTLAAGEVRWARANAAAVPYGIAASQITGPIPVSAIGGGGPAPTASPPDAGPPPAGGGSADGGTGTATSGPGNYGIDPSHWVVYLESDVPAGSLTEWWLGAPLAKGFHLLRVTPVKPQCIPADQIDACVAELGRRGVTDPDAARGFCSEPYQLSVAPPNEPLVLQLGTVTLATGGGGCP